jgi:diaminopimelate epimerase
MLPSEVADLRMRITNADGTEAEMCGNGVRALFLFALDRGALSGDSMVVQTPAGPRPALSAGPGKVTVGMGSPSCRRGDIPVEGPREEEAIDIEVPLDDGPLLATCVSMGNPHCVVFVEDVDRFPVESTGPAIENHQMFPDRTNVEFVQVLGGDTLTVRVWERGVGETMACGTGACACVVAASLKGLTGRRASVSLPGGLLEVDWGASQVMLTGPARHVYDGKTVG